MSDRNYTFVLEETENVGSDAGKHNFNALSLEANICNLKQYFTDISKNVEPMVIEFLRQKSSLENFNYTDKLNSLYTQVLLLSSYWDQHHFSVFYPVNLLRDDLIKCPNSENSEQLHIQSAQTWISSSFPAENFVQNTTVYVNMFIYSRPWDILQPGNLISITDDSENLSESNRRIKAVATQESVHFEYAKIFVFKKSGSSWIHYGTIGPNVDLNAATRRVITLTISGNIQDVTLEDLLAEYSKSKATPAYAAGKTDIILNVNSNVTISSSSNLRPALYLTTPYSGDAVYLFNYGKIIGAGGEGGKGGDSPLSGGGTQGKQGGSGGTAIGVHMPCVIENNGEIYAGGGGGGGGTGGLSGSNSTGGGGGGGAGKNPGKGGFRGQNSNYRRLNIMITDGIAGKLNTGGEGGTGISSNSKSAGGAGGPLGQKGLDSDSAQGGPAGNYVVGDQMVYWVRRGKVAGNIV